MKTINVSFEDKEFKRIRKAKELADANTWREWILDLATLSEWENKKK